MVGDIYYEREEETFSDTSREAPVPRKPHKGAKDHLGGTY